MTKIIHKIKKGTITQDSWRSEIIRGIAVSHTTNHITIVIQSIFQNLSHVISLKTSFTFCTNHLATLNENHNNQIEKSILTISLNIFKEYSGSSKIW